MSRLSDFHEAPSLPVPRIVTILLRIIWSVGILAFTIYIGGFLLYLSAYQRAAEPLFDKADAIVVLTGGPDRIAEATRLLAEKRGEYLLISGVNEQIDRDDLVRTVPQLAKFMTCCVILDRQSNNTHENALTTLAWARQNKFTSFILVTAHTHMPRALYEFHISGGDEFQISPWAVGKLSHPDEWWRDGATIRSMLVEYTKLTGVIARHAYVTARDGFHVRRGVVSG